jgi:hypothetical protein
MNSVLLKPVAASEQLRDKYGVERSPVTLLNHPVHEGIPPSAEER